MGFFDVLYDVLQSMAQSTVNRRSQAARQFEREHPNMDARTREKLNEFNRQTERVAGNFGSYTSTTTSANTKYMGKSISQWDCEWQSIGMLKDADLSPYNHCVGLYRHVVNGTTKYVGRAIELNNGGFRKRLSDYRRESGSARKHLSGRTIHEHLDEIETYILIVGDTPEAVEATKKLEGQFVRKYNPEWNKQKNI